MSEEFDQDELIDRYNAMVEDKTGPGIKPVAMFPDHAWVSMWKSRMIASDNTRLASYRCPDNFGMYIYNHFFGYGMQELIENQVSSPTSGTERQAGLSLTFVIAHRF